MFPIYKISADVQQVFLGMIVAGFPVALVRAWAFDITPAGHTRIVRLSTFFGESENP